MAYKRSIKLKYAISFLVILTAFCTMTVIWYTSFHALKQTLTDQYLKNNCQYAQKIALSTGDLLYNMEHNITSLAYILGKHEFKQEEMDEWRKTYSSYFNSIFTTDSDGVVQFVNPIDPQSKVQPGTKIVSDLMKQALKNKEPFISKPYLAQTGQLMLIISSPVFDEAGQYKGVVDGTVYLESDSSLKKMLNNHKFMDGSSVFVVDQSGKIIYHPDSSRINESLKDHPLVQSIIQGKSGSSKIINSEGIEYLAGYAVVEHNGWGIIIQTPTSVIEAPLHNLTKKVIFQSLPLLLLILISVWLLTNKLSKPLNSLARFSEEAAHKKIALTLPFDELKMNSHIYEIHQLYRHLNNYLALLNNQIKRDGLTGLYNRRTFNYVMKEWFDNHIQFSIILLDIDHFKKINDTYGHLVGDDVLRHLSSIMQETCREKDLCFRYGGEEFAILTPIQNNHDAFKIAERLRIKFSLEPNPTGRPITISLGISSFQNEDLSCDEMVKRADSALYQSKMNGRNKTTIYGK